MSTLLEDALAEFHTAGDVPQIIDLDAYGRQKALDLRMLLIREEYKELMDELLDCRNGVGNLEKTAKEMADVIYVVAGAAQLMEIPITRVFEAVHASNMSKVGEDGKIQRRADGKILKPETYREADLSFLGKAA